MGDIWALKGSNQILENVHPEGTCYGEWCTIHRPMPGPWADWPMRMARGQMLRMCPHGKPHPAIEDILAGLTWGIHKCDGCPCGPDFEEGGDDMT